MARSARVLLVALCCAAVVAQWASSLSFVAGFRAAAPARAAKVARFQQASSAEATPCENSFHDVSEGKLADRVEALRMQSLVACMLATEDSPEDVIKCAELSRELFSAEERMEFIEAKAESGHWGRFGREASY